MPRKIAISVQGNPTILTEADAKNELQLQDLIKNNPDLLPIEEYSMDGPLLVVGRETVLQSGAADLVALARSGHLLIIEFKTGPQNSDFRHALAQLFDYGSDVWGRTYEEFERSIAVRYFASTHCSDLRFHGKQSIEAAARELWGGLSDDDMFVVRDRLTKQLQEGAFHYILVAQRFTANMERTVNYLNAIVPTARFYAIELIHFASPSGMTAFETRTVLKPDIVKVASIGTIDEARLLSRIEDTSHKSAMTELLDVFRSLGLVFDWGTSGVSIRMGTPYSSKLVSVAWVFPPGTGGWYGLTQLTLGYNPASVQGKPDLESLLDDYRVTVESIEGGAQLKTTKIVGRRFGQDVLVSKKESIKEAVTQLVDRIGGAG